MLPVTINAVQAILTTDPTVSAEDRQAYLSSLKGKALEATTAPERLFTRAEVRGLFNRSSRCLQIWERKGVLIPVKIAGRCVGYPAGAVRKLLEVSA